MCLLLDQVSDIIIWNSKLVVFCIILTVSLSECLYDCTAVYILSCIYQCYLVYVGHTWGEAFTSSVQASAGSSALATHATRFLVCHLLTKKQKRKKKKKSCLSIVSRSFYLLQELFTTILANWQLWIPFQFLNFRFVPQQFQVPLHTVFGISIVFQLLREIISPPFVNVIYSFFFFNCSVF